MLLKDVAKNLTQNCIRMGGLPASLQEHGIAGSNSQRGNLRAGVRPRLVDNPEYADRSLDFAKDQAFIQLRFFKQTSDGIVHLGNLLDPVHNISKFWLVQHKSFV